MRGATTRTVAAAVTHSAHAAVPCVRPATSIRQVATDSRSPTYRHKPCTLGRSPGGLLPKLCPAVAQREKSLRRSLGGLLPKSCPAVAQREIRQRSLGGPYEHTQPSCCAAAHNHVKAFGRCRAAHTRVALAKHNTPHARTAGRERGGTPNSWAGVLTATVQQAVPTGRRRQSRSCTPPGGAAGSRT